MKMDVKLTALTAVAVVCVGVGLFFQFSGGADDGRPGLEGSGNGKRVERPRDRDAGRRVRRARQVREKPVVIDYEDEEIRELTNLARKLLESLQAALDAEDFENVQSIVEMIEDSPKGVLSKDSDGVPVYMRRKIVEALGWFGARGMPEIAAFLADANSEVAEVAMEQFELALQDISLGDRDRAEIVVMASKALHDSEALERIFMELSNMRPSVVVPTIKDICRDGTPEAKALMPETIEFVTGETIETEEGLDRWHEENPDGPDADDLYGPM